MPEDRHDGLHQADQPFPKYDHLSYQDFLNHHLLPNTPFLLSAKSTVQWACTSWRSPRAEKWISCDGPSEPNLEALRRFRDEVVPVANTLQREFSEFSRTERPLGEVLDLWQAGRGEGLYVKDWHLFAGLEGRGEGVGSVYQVPECFRDDWLNPPYTPLPRRDSEASPNKPADTCSDFRFCYLGPADTFTPLHRDVYASYSWSANVVGRKMWWFFPPDRLDRVKDGNGDLVFDVRQLADEGGAIKVLQQEGEVIFVPSGWHHQVLNLDFCISINHNFFASPTLPRVMTALQDAQARVEESIADVKEMIRDRVGVDGPWEVEWAEEVQKLLEMDAGWGWKGFWETVLANLRAPPADEALSPPFNMRDEWVNEVVARYRLLPEWDLLPAVRATVEEVEVMKRSKS